MTFVRARPDVGANSGPRARRRIGVPWITVALVACGVAVFLLPGAGEILEYDRAATTAGEIWRPLTAQLVHFTPRMALMDLGALLALGWLIERLSRGLATAVLCGSALAVAASVHILSPDLTTYRGASGIASGLLAAVGLEAWSRARTPALRWGAIAAGVLLAVKLVAEVYGAGAIAAGPLPTGVRAVPLVHLAGATAGAAVWLALASYFQIRRLSTTRPAISR